MLLELLQIISGELSQAQEIRKTNKVGDVIELKSLINGNIK